MPMIDKRPEGHSSENPEGEFVMPLRNKKPLKAVALQAYEARRDLASELLKSVKEMKAGQVHAIDLAIARTKTQRVLSRGLI
ncbi:hypothetical protein [Limnohabitans sp. JirII-31]|uniref:hypothetical protein n=1 Tax=Limnohabitans sp. JirII-31 TaxID=1977908 RepID=UPI00117A9CC2|nr:hypothetical protein [Limnohabitans sp. JirII-31]